MQQERAYGVLLETMERAGDGGETAADGSANPAPWISSMQATCDCLDWRGALPALTRRHAEDDLGESVYGTSPLHARSAIVTAHLLLDEGVIAPDELEAKLRQVRERFERT